MDAKERATTGYVVPSYEAPPGTAWYHFLHGNVPGHQIDFMYRPEVPGGSLTRQHFSHLARLVKYIEPRSSRAYAFAIGNLSRDDTQYEAGRGGVALIFGLRIRGAKDHAGRQDPPFCHAVAAIDRHLDAVALYEASLCFFQKLLPDEETQAEGSGWYHSYVRQAEDRELLLPLLRAYVADFEALPRPPESRLGLRWTVKGRSVPSRVVVVYGDDAPFSLIAACAARIAAVLIESDIRWTSISTGREADVPGGVSVRLVPAREAASESADARVLRLEEVPEAALEIAEQLFGAVEARGPSMPEAHLGWRELYGKEAPCEELSGDAELATKEVVREAPTAKPRAFVGLLMGVGVALALVGIVAAVAMSGDEAAEAGVEPPAASQVPEVKAVPTGTTAKPAQPTPALAEAKKEERVAESKAAGPSKSVPSAAAPSPTAKTLQETREKTSYFGKNWPLGR